MIDATARLSCLVEDCEKPRRSRGLCSAHHSRLLRTGSPTGTNRRTPEQRFIALAGSPDDRDGCWLWTGHVGPHGYARFDGVAWAHRWSYEHFVGPIPVGLEIDHLCRNRSCVNPDHLEPVTRRENLLRGDTFASRNAAKTHCIHGHEFTPANTYVAAGGGRYCRTCRAERERRRKARIRSAA